MTTHLVTFVLTSFIFAGEICMFNVNTVRKIKKHKQVLSVKTYQLTNASQRHLYRVIIQITSARGLIVERVLSAYVFNST